MKIVHSLLSAFVLMVLMVVISPGQAPYVAQFKVTDGHTSVVLSAGTAVGATYCLSPADALLGETELPPPGPADVFDARFVDIPGYSCKGQGVYKDFRPLGAGFYATDTFRLSLHAGGNANKPGPVTVSWSDTLSTKDGGYWSLVSTDTTKPIFTINLATQQPDTIVIPSGIYLLYHGDSTMYLTFDYSRLYSADHNAKVQTPNKPGGKKSLTVPNVFDLGEISFLKKGTSFVVGSNHVRSVLVKGWSSVLKDVGSTAHFVDDWQGETAYQSRCLDSIGIPKFGKPMKPVKKQLTSLVPQKDQTNNWLFAQLLTLHATLQMYAAGLILPGDFGDLQISSGTYKGWSVNLIAACADTLISCDYDTGAYHAYDSTTFNEVAHELQMVNDAFTMNNQYAVNQLDTAALVDAIGNWNSGKGKTVTVRGNVPIAKTFLVRPVAGSNSPHTEKTRLEAASKPKQFELYQNYPNPFNPTTTIQFDLPVQSNVTLKVYDLLGREVASLVDREQMSAGSHEVRFAAPSYASGVYYYKITANGGTFQSVKKMVLLK